MREFEAVGEAVTGALVGRAVEPGAGELSRRPYPRNRLPELRHAAGGRILPCLRPARPCPPHADRLLPRFPSRRAPFRGEDLAHVAAAGVETGRPHPALIEGERASFIRPSPCSCSAVFLMFAAVSLLGRRQAASRQKTKPASGNRAGPNGRRPKLRMRSERSRCAGEQPTAKLDERIGEVKARSQIKGAIEASARATQGARSTQGSGLASTAVSKAARTRNCCLQAEDQRLQIQLGAHSLCRCRSCGCCSRSAAASGSTTTRSS